ncbi:hypothetical protein TH66_12310 [Carbonactinospora thermoautotrophica]|uniref:Uncharacterized protein n=1 Tax=Carbonactinospora thermoautotrophica TaxID=1469144 RepID=A0A132MXE5_9ACTN|nr:hypothetical protein [Carbonactinospora thermoautotrophica]KWX02513.1 hypothetical protein LI90_3556 [Carbonactinospora thermoautotrophica]KWX03619.1 hypothetical protein TH66_12310 [Carbonactinospora thermoautotrophica]KWX09004.1 hypothetical protein TR74_12245 [Carbonactinospora thermoautotrophica]
MSNEIDAKPRKTTPAAVSARWLLKALCGTLNAVVLLLTLLCYLVRMDPSDQDTIVFAHFTGWAAAGLGVVTLLLVLVSGRLGRGWLVFPAVLVALAAARVIYIQQAYAAVLERH